MNSESTRDIRRTSWRVSAKLMSWQVSSFREHGVAMVRQR